MEESIPARHASLDEQGEREAIFSRIIHQQNQKDGGEIPIGKNFHKWVKRRGNSRPQIGETS